MAPDEQQPDERSADQQRLIEALNNAPLTDQQRDAVWLLLVRRRTLRQAGERLAVSHVAVWKWLKQACVALPDLYDIWAERCAERRSGRRRIDKAYSLREGLDSHRRTATLTQLRGVAA